MIARQKQHGIGIRGSVKQYRQETKRQAHMQLIVCGC